MRNRLQQRACFNDGVRGIIAASTLILGAFCSAMQRIHVAVFPLMQSVLRRRYRVGPATPVLSYGPEVEASIQSAASRIGSGARWAETSGSTGAPKRILFTKARLRSARWAFIDHFARLFYVHRGWRTSLYVFRPIDDETADRSLTSLLVEERRSPSYLETLQAPYRVESDPAIHALVKRYGPEAVRLWLLTLANPGALYCTNPSTLWLFLHRLVSAWENTRRLIVDFVTAPQTLPAEVHSAARRLASAGCEARLRRVASSASPLPLAVCAPAARTVVAWTGGYVKPFLDRLAAILPPDRYRFLPMYSMSTETIETSVRFKRNGHTFAPVASGVLYEFIEEGLQDRPENLRAPHELDPMKQYTMVVSDAFGLRRYQTEDVFLCRSKVDGMPDLHFLRRRNLEYSFTGEKVSSIQLARVFSRLRSEPSANIPLDAFLTCVPSDPSEEALPHYRIVLACNSAARPGMAPEGDAIAGLCDVLLQEENAEYRAKRTSGRLGAPRLCQMPFDAFVAAFSGAETASAADGQFKFLPLYRTARISLPLA